jgi:sporulation integral membrane protein YtvI
LNNLLNDLPDYQGFSKQLDWISERNQQLSRVIEELKIPESFKESINSNFQYFYDKAKEIIQLASSTLLGVVKKLPNFATILLISLIATFFISRDKELILEALLKPFPNKWRHKIKQVQGDIMKAGIGFIRAQILLITITTLISIIGLSILGSSYSIVVGLTGGLLDLIPVIGPSLIFIPWAIYNLIVGNVSFAIGLFILYGVMGATRQILEAKIVGRSIGIHPLAILVAMYLGVQLFGVAGFFIGPASLVVLKAVFQAGFISIIIDE